ncbi:unnamed protein product [Prorocentrum cordatum]|uniref:ASCH domain-containing protein n=1 Tax=Prorocentrum cordatum TaxID=2364126 RepID=A0ABN9W7T3_9DINO|nr:unnamed protein product [Polarella glacialis]
MARARGEAEVAGLSHGGLGRRPSPPRVTEAEVRRERRLRGAGGAAAEGVPTTVLSLHQPLASFLAHGLQRIEGRGWTTEFRGPLWIHAGSRQPAPEDIARWEALYRDAFAVDGHEVHMPQQYPTSALVGLVEVVDVLSAEELAAWRLPRGVRREARSHGSGFLFLVEQHRRLVVPLKMSGQHKLWRLDKRTAAGALRGLVPAELEPPLRFDVLRALGRGAPAEESDSGPDESGRHESDSEDEAVLAAALQLSLGDRAPAATAASMPAAAPAAWPTEGPLSGYLSTTRRNDLSQE